MAGAGQEALARPHQIGMGGFTGAGGAAYHQQRGRSRDHRAIQPGMGGTIYVQFPKAVPDLTPEQLKQILGPFLDFSKERSAAVALD